MGTVAAWVHHVRDTSVAAGGFIDDRTGCIRVPNPGPILERAVRVSFQVAISRCLVSNTSSRSRDCHISMPLASKVIYATVFLAPPIATRSFNQRRRLARVLLNSAICWTGAYNTPPQRLIEKWPCNIERTVRGGLPIGRSRLLTWAACLGQDLDPQFFVDANAVKLDAWHAHRLASNIGIIRTAAAPVTSKRKGADSSERRTT